MSRPQAGDDRPAELVLLHGFALHSALWGNWTTGLDPPMRTQVIDLPGHGLEPWDDRIADLAGLARAIGDQVPRGAIVLGWSLGGMVALELARQRAGELGGLVLIATTPRFLAAPDWPQGIAARVLEDFTQGIERDYERTVRDFLALQVHGAADPRATLRTLRAGLRSRPAPDPRALATGLEILRTTDLRGILPLLGLPTLVLTGQHDRLTHPRAGHALANAMPQGEFREVAGAGHAPFLSHPAIVCESVSGYLARLRSSPPVPTAVSS